MATDFLTDDQGDLIITDGDFAFGDSSDQHIKSILLARKGEIRDFPLVGIGIQDYLNSPNSQSLVSRLKRDSRIQLESDGAKQINIQYDETYQISADYGD